MILHHISCITFLNFESKGGTGELLQRKQTSVKFIIGAWLEQLQEEMLGYLFIIKDIVRGIVMGKRGNQELILILEKF